MAKQRIVYSNWIADIGYDPSQQPETEENGIPDHLLVSFDEIGAAVIAGPPGRKTKVNQARLELLQAKVRTAVELLDDEEREFIIRFHFMGESYRQISERSGRAIYRLEALHKRAVRKLKNELTSFVAARFGVKQSPVTPCRLCTSPHRDQIDRIIGSRDRSMNWRPVIRLLRDKCNLKIKSPQLLIGHEKYH